MLLESIRCENGRFPLLEWHQNRIRKSFGLLWPEKTVPELQQHLLQFPIPSFGLFKCRLLYGPELSVPEYRPYVVRVPRTLRCVSTDDLEYNLKWADRSRLESLQSQRDGCDDVLILKNGLVTDTTYANIAFMKNGQWYTPDKPLLEGVRRTMLLSEGVLRTGRIGLSDLSTYTHFKIINAMLAWDESIPIPVENIIW